MSHEMIISGGTVVDGSGADGFKADVAIDNGKISRIGDLQGEQAAKTVDTHRQNRYAWLCRLTHSPRRPGGMGSPDELQLLSRCYHSSYW